VVPWRRKVWVQELTGEELDEYREPMSVIDSKNNIKLNLKESSLRLLAMAIRDANGNRIYPNTEAGSRSSARCRPAAWRSSPRWLASCPAWVRTRWR